MNTKSFELSLEQEFQYRLMAQAVEKMNREQMADLLLQTSRLLMMKDNAIRDLVKGNFFDNA